MYTRSQESYSPADRKKPKSLGKYIYMFLFVINNLAKVISNWVMCTYEHYILSASGWLVVLRIYIAL